MRVERHDARLSSENALEIFAGYDIVVDGTDNFATRYLVNDACVLTGRPNVSGSVFRFDGQVSVFGSADGPCYRCLFPEPPPAGSVPNCEEGGVLGVLPGLVGTIQATETLKLILGAGEPLIGRLLLVDALRMQFRTLKFERDPSCPACGTRTLKALVDYDAFCGVGAGRRGWRRSRRASSRRGWPVRSRRLLLDVREPREWEIARIAGARLVPLGHAGGGDGVARPERGDRRPLQVGGAERARGAAAARGGIRVGEESCRRDPALDRRRGPQRAALLNGLAYLGVGAAALGAARWWYPRAVERASAARFPVGADGIIPGAQSILLEGRGPRGILVLHGFGDTPQSVGDLARALHAQRRDRVRAAAGRTRAHARRVRAQRRRATGSRARDRRCSSCA